MNLLVLMLLVTLAISLLAPCAQAAQGSRFYLARAGKPVCVLLASPKSELERRAVRAVVDGLRDVSGVGMPLETRELPPHVMWALVKGKTPAKAWRSPLARPPQWREVAKGFALRRHDQFVALLAADERAGYHGSVYFRDTLLKVEGHDVLVEEYPELAAPLSVRGTYNLACWGRSPEYRRQDWEVVLDAMAEDGMNTVYFWLSGLFRSQKHPEAFTYKQTVMRTQDIRELIRYAHSIGIDFYLGSGVFAWLAVDALAEAYPETRAVGSGGMCPSNDRARQLNLEYLLELFDTFPEADGLFLEIRDEYGACQCQRCQGAVGDGSKQYGQAELSFLRELAAAVWQHHPKAKLVWCIGYSEGGSHANDPGYYEQVRAFGDPRFQWLVVRGNWEFPGAEGKNHPLTHFSPQMIHWNHYYMESLDSLRAWLQRSAHERLLGVCPAFEPGFSSASYYSNDIPFPVDAIPYVVTRFIYRTFSWEPDLSLKAFRERLHRKFFTPEIAPELTEDLLYLFDLVRTTTLSAHLQEEGRWEHGVLNRQLTKSEETPDGIALSPDEWAALSDRFTNLADLASRTEPRLREIEERVAAQRPASARSERGLAMIRRCINDTRAELLLTPELQVRVRAVVKRATKNRDDLSGRKVRVSATSEWNRSTYSSWKAIDGKRETSWLAADNATLPVALTIEFREPTEIGKVLLVQGTFHEAYNTRAYRVEVSTDGKTFERVADGEFRNARGDERTHTLPRTRCRALRVVVTSVYPNIAYSSPSLAEVTWE